MASNFIGINRGQLDYVGSKITAGSSTGSTDIELRMDTGKNLTKEDVVKALNAFRAYILGDGVPGGQKGTFVPPL